MATKGSTPHAPTPWGPVYDVNETAVFAKFAITPDDRSEAWISINNVTSDNSLPTNMPIVDAANGVPLSDFEPTFNVFTNFNLPTAN